MGVFISWSGGKESSLSCFRVMQNQNLKVEYLLNMITEDGKHSRSHGLSVNLLKLQAEAMEIPIVQRKVTWEGYEEEFKKALLSFKARGIQAGVFGDIDLKVHRDWVERVCKEVGIQSILPLWKEKREELLNEFIQAGFKAIVVSANTDFLGREWLEKEINKRFIEELRIKGDIDFCGERGEYHTFVYDGPIFKKPVEFTIGKKVLKDKHWFLELIPK
jgi:uncharacterized protein (TIGR00290 family)